VTPLSIPRGGHIALELSYTGELLWDDWEGPGCAYWQPTRHLLYPLAPAGYWAGRPDAVEIRVDLGALAGIARVVGPPGSRRSGSLVEWKLERPDLKTVPDLHMVVDLTRHQPEAFAALNNEWLGALSIDPTAAAGLVDGKLSTEYCPSGKSAVELRMKEHPYWYAYAYLALRSTTEHDRKNPMAITWPRTCLARTRARAPRPGELELHRPLPGPLWDAGTRPAFALVPARGTDWPRTVRVSLCGHPELAEKLRLDDRRLGWTGADGARRVVSLYRPSGALGERFLAALKSWSEALVRTARPCIGKCQSSRCRGAKAADERALACRLKCEVRCVHDAARAAAPARRPCLRFGFEVEEAGGKVCLAEIAPLLGPPCE